MDTRQPTYFLSHGGGPWPFMKEQYGDTYNILEAALAAIPSQLPAPPKAVLVVTAHWEENNFTVSSGAQPGMIYDYGGFPAHTYQVKYKAPGSPELAQRVADLLDADQDATRGFDHGTFSMMYPIYPDAHVPIVQLSLKHGLSPIEHLEAGRKLAPLRDEGILILGSGLSFHNLHQFGPSGRKPSHEFDGWLRAAMLQLPPQQRTSVSLHWDQAPYARLAHPREEHLIPLLVALGAAEQDPASLAYHEDEFFGHLSVSSYRFG